MLQRRMGREHVVIGIDDGDIGCALPHHLYRIKRAGATLVGRLHGSKGMRHIGATHALGARRAGSHGLHLRHIRAARSRTARGNALGDRKNDRMHCHSRVCNLVT